MERFGVYSTRKKEATNYEASYQLYMDMLKESADTANALAEKENASEGSADYLQYSLREEFSSEFDQWLTEKTAEERSKDGGYFEIGRTSNSLSRIGVKNASIVWRKQKIQKIMNDHLEMIPDVIKDVPSIIEHPVVVMKSQTRGDSIVMFGDVPSTKGPVMVAINLTPIAAGGLEADFNLISSAYGRTESNAKTLIESSEILYLGEKNRAETLLMSLRVQFPSDQQAFDSTLGSISYEGNSVKIFGKKIFENFSESEKGGLKPSIKDKRLYYFPPSQASSLAMAWSHSNNTITGDQGLVFYRDSWYIIEKFDDAATGYQIVEKIKTSDYSMIKGEIKKYGNYIKGSSIGSNSSLIAVLNGKGSRSFARKQSSNAISIEYGGNDSEPFGLGSSESERRHNRNNGSGIYASSDNDIQRSDEIKPLLKDAPIQQDIQSWKTSIKQIPALFTNPNVEFGKVNIDIGGGRFDLATNYLAEQGTKNLVFDPYNRDEQTNAATLRYLQDGNKADTATCANVLNVIAEQSARRNVILEVAKSIKQDGKAYFMVYEGDGSGIGRETSAGYQQNKKTADYLPEISECFEDVTRKGKLIIASNPVSDLPQAYWETKVGEAVRYSLKDSPEDSLRKQIAYWKNETRLTPDNTMSRTERRERNRNCCVIHQAQLKTTKKSATTRKIQTPCHC